MAIVVEVGSRIGPYLIEGELGRGGMGRVFVCDHVNLRRKAALKVLAPALAGDATFRERFIRESQLVAAIEHPNMIPIYDAGEAEALLFIAMRFVDGRDLKAVIAENGGLRVTEALEIVGQAAAALDAAHARDIVHRDVKPANILLDEPTGRIFLTDFGVAGEARGSADEEGLIVGTIDYASPEQIQGKPTGVATDVYALGGVLYEAITGERPYPKETEIATIYAHLRDDPPRVTDKRPDVPAALDLVVASALAKDEADRFPSCGDLVAAARAALEPARTVTGPAPRVLEVTPEVSLRRDGIPLPAPASPLVGRERELAEVTATLRRDDVRLLTLTGPGGTGKTTLGIQASADVIDVFDGRVYFASLTAINDPALVVSAVASALGVEEARSEGSPTQETEARLLEVIRAQLGSEPVLLVLDNFEHLLPAARLISELLATTAALKLLVTSRSLLRVRDEHEIVVRPLELPEPGTVADVDALRSNPAIALFVARAAAVRPGFALDDDNAGAVVEICRRLDGLPLALELAAARMKVLSPRAVASRLDNRLQLLTGGARDVHTRHQTLRSTIDWSYDLLDAGARTTLARAGVFAGGFTLEAAEFVCASDEHDADAVVGSLLTLVDEHLAGRHDTADGDVRFELLETIREYALFRLIEQRELDELRRRHVSYFVDFAETAEPHLTGSDQTAWAKRLDEETGNIRAALTWSLDGGDVETAMRITAALFRFWSIRGRLSEARRWLEQALAGATAVAPHVHAKALFAAGYTALGQGDFADAVSRFDESLALYRSLDDQPGCASCLAQLGWLAAVRGDFDRAAELSSEALGLARALGDGRTASTALNALGDVAYARGADADAVALYTEALASRRALGDIRIVADSLLKTGRAELLKGDRTQAEVLLEEGLAIARELGDGWTTSVAVASLAAARLAADDVDACASLLTEALTWARQRGDKRVGAEAMTGIAVVLTLRKDDDGAASVLSAAQRLRDSINAKRTPLEDHLIETYLTRIGDRNAPDAGGTSDFASAAAFALARVAAPSRADS